MRQDLATNLSQSETDWTQNYGEGGRASCEMEATTFWCKKNFLGGKISPHMSPLISFTGGGQRHEGCENCMVRAKPFYLSSTSAIQ